MAKNRKCYIRNSLIEVCFRVEEGLPLVATPFVMLILQSVLARAQTYYPVRIVAFVVMGNHIHILLVVQEPRDIPRFKEYVKRELAHAINHLLGRVNRTVWVDGADDPVILDSEKAIERIVYTYTNPQKANLEETIDDYPNLSSWKAFLDGGETATVKRISRPAIPTLPARTLSLEEQAKLAEILKVNGYEEYELFIEPDAWLEVIPDAEGLDPEVVRNEIISRVRQCEAEYRKSRRHPVVGAHALRLQSIRKNHTPKKRGKKMICLATLKQTRINYIAWKKERDQLARDLYQKWLHEDQTIELPPGMFWPGGHLALPCELTVQCFTSDH